MICIMKHSLSKSVGQALLTFEIMDEALLDVESFMNNRPLSYMGEECEEAVLTPNLLLKGTEARFLEEDLEALNYTDEEKIVTRHMKYLQKTRQQLRSDGKRNTTCTSRKASICYGT